MATALITLDEERYLRSLLGQPDDRTATKALQEFCEQLRKGAMLIDPSRTRASVKLCLYRPSPSLKRWAINTLTRIGTAQDIPGVMAVWRDHPDDPDMLGAVVAAVYALTDEDNASATLEKSGIALEGVSLIAASQYSLKQKRRLVETVIPLEKADDAQLRSGIVLAGTGKSPEHLFDKKYTNAISLGQLNHHNTPSVSKYSIWALAELDLGFSALSIPISSLESQPAEVRKWIFRLLFRDAPALRKSLEMITVASRDSDTDVREESAIALRDTYVEGMDSIVLKWCFSEAHLETRSRLVEHMASQSDRSQLYADAVLELYKNELVRSDRRARIESAAAKTGIYNHLRKIDISQEMGTMFANDNILIGRVPVTIEQNFHNNNIGAVSGSGDIITQTMQSVGTVQNDQLRSLLESVLAELQNNPNTPEAKSVADAVGGVAQKPSKPMLERLVGALGTLKTGTAAVGSIFKNVDGLIDQAGDVMDSLS
jgi:hypothetical protein